MPVVTTLLSWLSVSGLTWGYGRPWRQVLQEGSGRFSGVMTAQTRSILSGLNPLPLGFDCSLELRFGMQLELLSVASPQSIGDATSERRGYLSCCRLPVLMGLHNLQ